MSSTTSEILIGFIFILVFFFGFFAIIMIDDKIQKNHELTKLGIIKPKNKNFKGKTDNKNSLINYLYWWIITIVGILIIGIFSKIFNFGIKDIIEIFK